MKSLPAVEVEFGTATNEPVLPSELVRIVSVVAHWRAWWVVAAAVSPHVTAWGSSGAEEAAGDRADCSPAAAAEDASDDRSAPGTPGAAADFVVGARREGNSRQCE